MQFISNNSKTGFFIIHGLISLVFLLAVLFIPDKRHSETPEVYKDAAMIMEKSLEDISIYCKQQNIPINYIDDPAQTGLIGPELTEITSSTGHLEAKRSTINPNFAALIAHWLTEAGVENGDTISLGCSGSFPALLIASLSAANAMNLETKVILSVGASSFGATNINFTLLDIYEVLYSNGLVNSWPVAVTPGGIDDLGREFPDSVISNLQHKIGSLGIPFLYEEDLQSNVQKRMSFYFNNPGSEIKLFINTGGAHANIGTSPDILLLPPGLIFESNLPEKSSRGMIYAMLARGIPVIHLLFIKGIVQEHGLVWDPVSIPEYNAQIFSADSTISAFRLISSILYMIYFSFLLFRYNKLYNIK